MSVLCPRREISIINIITIDYRVSTVSLKLFMPIFKKCTDFNCFMKRTFVFSAYSKNRRDERLSVCQTTSNNKHVYWVSPRPISLNGDNSKQCILVKLFAIISKACISDNSLAEFNWRTYANIIDRNILLGF